MSLYKHVSDVIGAPDGMPHNVPAVYDVFAVAIKEREAFQQPQKCGGTKMYKGRKPDYIFV